MSKSDDRPYLYGSTLRAPRKPMRKVSEKRARERGMTARKYGPHHAFVRDNYACVLVDHPHHTCWQPDDAPYPIDSHHCDPQLGDPSNCVPCCRKAHDAFHALVCDNDRILARFGVDLLAIASDLWARSPVRHRYQENSGGGKQ